MRPDTENWNEEREEEDDQERRGDKTFREDMQEMKVSWSGDERVASD